LAPVTWPVAPGGGSPTIGNVFSNGFYDWLKRGGTKARVDAMKSMMTQPFLNSPSSSGGGGLMQNYECEPDGTILQTLHASTSTPDLQDSEKQWKSKATVIDSATLTTYDVTARDYVRQPGRQNGGKHSGEPLADPLLDTTVLAQFHITGSSVAQLPSAGNNLIAQGLELGAGGCGAGGPPCGGGGGSCGGGGGSCGGDGDGDDGTNGCSGGTSINFSQGPGQGPGAVRDTYLHNGIAVDFQFKSKGGSSGSSPNGGPTTDAVAGP